MFEVQLLHWEFLEPIRRTWPKWHSVEKEQIELVGGVKHIISLEPIAFPQMLQVQPLLNSIDPYLMAI